MFGVDLSLATLLRWIRPGVRWLEPTFPAVLAFLALFGAHFLRSTHLFTAIASALPYSTLASFSAYLIAPLAAIMCWFIGVHLYLRSGHGPKLGLVYEAFAVEEPYVQKVKQILRELYNDVEMHHHTSLRFLPRRAISNAQTRDRYIRRFNFSIIAHIGQTKAVDSTRPHFDVEVYMNSKATNKQVIDNMIRAYFARQQASNTKPLSVLDLFKKSASTLNDLMLTCLAIQKLLTKDFADAAALLRRIEDLTPDSLDPTKPPRSIVRGLDAFARLQPIQFPASDIPEPDRLRDMLVRAETASRYATQFTVAANTIGRLRFLSGDSDGALTVIDECLQENPAAKHDPFVLVSKAFLEFYFLRWQNAHDYYCKLLDNPNVFTVRWKDDLVPFASYAADILTEGAQVLQTLYARLANCSVTTQIEAEAFAWIDADATRSPFRDLLRRAPEVWTAHHSSKAASRSKQKSTRPSGKSKPSKGARRKRKKRRK